MALEFGLQKIKSIFRGTYEELKSLEQQECKREKGPTGLSSEEYEAESADQSGNGETDTACISCPEQPLKMDYQEQGLAHVQSHANNRCRSKEEADSLKTEQF